MTIRNIFFALCFVSILIGVPFGVGSQDTPPSSIVPCENNCEACHVVELGENIIDWAAYLSIGIATIMIVFAGLGYLFAGGDTGKIAASTAKITQVLTGIVIIFVSWIIVNTVMVLFLPGGTLEDGLPWNSVTCVEQPAPPEGGGISTSILPVIKPPTPKPPFDINDYVDFPPELPPVNGIPIIGNPADVGGTCRGEKPSGEGVELGLGSYTAGAFITFWTFVDTFESKACTWTCEEGMILHGAGCTDDILGDTPGTTPPEWGEEVSRFVLVNADTEGDLGYINNSDTIPLNTLPTGNLNIRAEYTSSEASRVEFGVNGLLVSNEITPPFAVFGDISGDYNAWAPTAGLYQLSAQPYTGSTGTTGGTAGTPESISFEFTAGGGGTNPPSDDPGGVTGPVILGAIGCSQTRDVMDGYRVVGGTDAWSNDVTGDLGGKALGEWADTNHLAWDVFDAGMAEHPDTNVIWWEICLKGVDRADTPVPSDEEKAMAEVVIDEINKRAPGVTVYVSGQNMYEGITCALSGINGPTAANALADYLAEEGLAERGPVVGPLSASQVTGDNCHANTLGEELQGQQLLDWVLGLEDGGGAPPGGGDPPVEPPIVSVGTSCGNLICDSGLGETNATCPWDCTPYTIPKAGEVGSSAYCSRTYTGFVPLTEVGTNSFAGFSQGGLYPGGSNSMPAAHRTQGEAKADIIDASSGTICLISIGMSNTNQKWEYFMTNVVPTITSKNSKVVVANGAVGSQPVSASADLNSGFWGLMENQINADGCEVDEVRAVWLMHAMQVQVESDSGYLVIDPGLGNATFNEFNTKFKSRLRDTVINLNTYFPNLEQIFLSSRTYAGYGSKNNNPEPYAYWGGYVVKDLIDDQILGVDSALSMSNGFPWMGWGPYLWTDGLGKDGVAGGTGGRVSDGLELACSDFQQNDGIHPEAGSESKASEQLKSFFTTDSTAARWFMQ